MPSVDSSGTAGVILFTDSIYAIATAKTNAEKAAIEGCKGCKVLSIEDTPIGDLSNRMGQLTTSLLAKYGKAWTYSIGGQRPLFRFRGAFAGFSRCRSGNRLPAADRGGRRIGAGLPAHPAEAISARDRGGAAASARLAMHRRDEPGARRSAAERLRAACHLFINANIDKDGGAQNIFDPGNGYKDEYKKIWGVK